MTTSTLRSALMWFLPAIGVCGFGAVNALVQQDEEAREAEEEAAVTIQYLEIVTSEVDAMVELLGKQHGVSFSSPVAEFGNARTARLADGGAIGVRAPMRPDEGPVVRPYLLVADIDKALEEAKAAGAEVAIPPMPIPDGGKFAIFIQGGIQHGLWQL